MFCGDPFDLDAEVEVKLTNEDVEFFNSQPSQEEVRARVQRRLGRHEVEVSIGARSSAVVSAPPPRRIHSYAHGLSAVPHAALEAFAEDRRALRGGSGVSRLGTAS